MIKIFKHDIRDRVGQNSTTNYSHSYAETGTTKLRMLPSMLKTVLFELGGRQLEEEGSWYKQVSAVGKRYTSDLGSGNFFTFFY